LSDSVTKSVSGKRKRSSILWFLTSHKKRRPMRLSTAQIKSVLSEFASEEPNALQSLIEFSLEAFMKSERHEYLRSQEGVGDKGNGYRNVHTFGTNKLFELRVPRTRSGNFYPVILGLIKDQEEECRKLAFELYSKGLTTDQVSDVFERFYGKSYSKASISRMFDYAREEVKYWLERQLESYYPIVYIDATFWNTRRMDQVSKEAYYTILGVKPDKTREVLAVVNFPTESATGWAQTLSELRKRGVKRIDLVVADGLRGIEEAVCGQFPDATFQKCVVHLMRNILSKVKPADKSEVGGQLKEVFTCDYKEDNPEKGWNRFTQMISKWEKKYPSLRVYQNRVEYGAHFSYLAYHEKVRPMIYSTNWIERLNRDYKRTLRMRGVMPDPASVLLLIGNVAMTRTAFDKKVASLGYETNLFDWDD
jgi:putative transposase